MARFRIMVHGHGINMPVADRGSPIIGFYTTRFAEGETVAAAIDNAKDMILEEWRGGPYAKANKGTLPTIEIEAVTSVSWFRRVPSKNTGYTFYSEP